MALKGSNFSYYRIFDDAVDAVSTSILRSNVISLSDTYNFDQGLQLVTSVSQRTTALRLGGLVNLKKGIMNLYLADSKLR